MPLIFIGDKTKRRPFFTPDRMDNIQHDAPDDANITVYDANDRPVFGRVVDGATKRCEYYMPDWEWMTQAAWEKKCDESHRRMAGVETITLKGQLLDYWVSRALGYKQRDGLGILPYSTSWEHGGKVIERERISIKCKGGGAYEAYLPTMPGEGSAWPVTGETHLIAAMRAFVVGVFGDVVERGMPRLKAQ